MSMDVTHLFKAAVLAVKVQRKSEISTNNNNNNKNKVNPPADSKEQKRRLKNQTLAKRDEFSRQAREICHKITTLRNFLLENRAAYMRIGQHLKSSASITDEQRDLIDRESEKFFIYYTQYLAQLRADWKKSKRKPQQQAHMEAVLDLLVNYLHDVQKIYYEQKKYRVQYELDTYRMIKLAANKKDIPVCPGGNTSLRNVIDSSSAGESTDIDDNENEKRLLLANTRSVKSKGEPDESPKLRRRFKHRKTHNSSINKQSHGLQVADDSDNDYDGDGENLSILKATTPVVRQVAVDEDMIQQEQRENDALSADDVQLFEKENDVLFQELQGLSQEIEAIEKNVVEIAQLQDIFTEKVSLQQNNIERIANAVVGATENVKDANEQIRRAIQRNAGLRVWSLFFLLVMSFALLFLDWYYD